MALAGVYCAYQEWLNSQTTNMLLTLTLKQAKPRDNGTFQYYTREHFIKTAWILRDRFVRKLVGPSAFRKGKRVPFLVFVEGDGIIKRYHFHVLTQVPSSLSTNEVHSLLLKVVRNLDTIYEFIDVRPILYTGLVKYSLKEGFDAFVPEASFLDLS